jgi:RNA polymerase sigma-70 factor (ECF subfamily)
LEATTYITAPPPVLVLGRLTSARRQGVRTMAQPSVGEPDSVPITELLVRAGTGDRDAFTALYDSVVPRVFGLARRVVRDPAQAEEVAQEVMVEVWRSCPRFDPKLGSALAWIMAITHRRAVDRVRSEQASRRRAEYVGAREDTVAPDPPAEAAERAEELNRVRAALDVLTDLQRQAVQLAYFEGYTYRQVAETLQIPLGTIKTRIRDALIRLRPALEDQG